MIMVNNRLTADLKAAFPDDKFLMKQTGKFYLLYHTLDTRNMTVGEYGKLQSILDFHAAITDNTTMIFDEESLAEKLKGLWKEDEELEGN